LSRFDFILKYVPETRMGKMDRLSRRPDWKVGVDKDNENQIIIKDNWLRRIKEVIIEELEVEILEKIKKARDKDKEVFRIVEEMKKAEVKAIQGEEWKMEGELILKEGKVYIPKDEELRTEIIQLYHDILMVGHRGKWKTVELVARSNKRSRVVCGRV